MPKPKPTGFVLYRGPSLIDGAPIVAIAITSSSNRKTGNMVQTYILRADVDPLTASRQGADVSICGTCPHRHHTGGACYVNLGRGPRAVFDAYMRGRYPQDPSAAAFASLGRMVRLGTYGDPAAVPTHVWQSLTAAAAGHTGYTHQWANPHTDPALATLCMASVDSDDDAARAIMLGWRYFRIRPGTDAPLHAREFVCPASEEAGKRKTCATCKACSGTPTGATPKASAVIVVHGAMAIRFDKANQ